VDQLLLPGGGHSTRLTDVMDGPAATTPLGFVPPTEDMSPTPEIEAVTVMTPVEAASLVEQEESRRYTPKVVVNATGVMRARHHQIARLLAAGTKPAEIARLMGTTATSVAMLERSPVFQALLHEYMSMMDKQAIESFTRMKVLGNLTLDELTTRVVESPAGFKASELIELAKMASDRTGLGPTSNKQVTLNGALTAADIRGIKTAGPIIEAHSWETDEGADSGDPAICAECETDDGAAESGEGVREEGRADADVDVFIEGLITNLVGIR
jgi:DNA-binding CsgD family transcriptional regulator